MSTETKVAVKIHASNKKVGKLVRKYNVKDAGTGTKFWVTVLKEKMNAIATLRLSKDGTKVYARVAYAEGKEVTIGLGMYYDVIQSLSDFADTEMDIVLAPRIPNPALTDADIDAQEANITSIRGAAEGQRAVARIKAARASDELQGEFVLVSYTEPEVE